MTAKLLGSWSAIVAVAALLVGCGGGGGGGDTSGAAGAGAPPVAATTPFPLAAGYQALISGGESENFNLSGSCSGTATITTSATVAATFEGTTGYAGAQVSTVTFSNCLPASSTANGTTYYNAGYLPIGLSIVGGEYAVSVAAPTAIPANVMVGDSGTISTLTSYSSNTKATVTGKRVIGYQIEADTSTTAIANITTRSYNTSDQLLSTQQSRYRMAASGTLTLVSIDVQFSTTSAVHLLYAVK